MMNYSSPLPSHDLQSVMWFDSGTFPGVRYAIRRVSLAQRIDLTARVRDLTRRNEYLEAGSDAEKIEGIWADLLVERLYVEWGLASVEGLTIDGQPVNAQLLIDKGPEELSREIAETVQRSLTLTEAERKNY